MRRHVEEPRMRGRTKGFTLVELLVVITIIAMLMGLLIPAVVGARAQARRTECMNNMKNLAQAIFQFESSKGRYMGRTYDVRTKGTTQPQLVPWTFGALPYLGRRDIVDAFMDNPSDPTILVYLPLFVCPNDADANSQVDQTPLSYAVNGGRPDSPPAQMPLDHKENGIFHDHFTEKLNNSPITKVSLSFVSKKDGSSNTILLAEKLSTDFARANGGVSSWTDPESQWNNALAWYLVESSPPPERPLPLTMRQWGMWVDGQADEEPPLADRNERGKLQQLAVMRPTSDHGDGFHVAFADASVRYLNDDIRYTLYAQLMTPDGRKAREPGGNAELTASISPQCEWVGGIINEADFE